MSEPNKLPIENEENANVNDILNDIKNAITSPDEGDDVIVLSKKAPENNESKENQEAKAPETVAEPVQVVKETVEEAKAEPAVEAPQEAVAEVQPATPDALLSNEVMLKTREMVKQVAANRNDNNPRSGGSSLEQMIIEAIKPQMTEWLNDNLPSIVKEIVEKEIKKVMANE